MSMDRALLLLIAVGILALVACGGGGQNTQDITVKMSDYKFDPATVTVKANTPVKLNLQNTGTVRHDWTLENFPEKVQVVADPGQTKSVEFTPKQTGTHKVVCTQPGHSDLGMVGQLVVQ